MFNTTFYCAYIRDEEGSFSVKSAVLSAHNMSIAVVHHVSCGWLAV